MGKRPTGGEPQRAVIMQRMVSPRDTNKQAPVPADRALSWEERKQDVRAQFAVRPLTHAERQAADDETWALHDAEVQALYRGQFVVPYEGKVVAHGLDAEQVLQEA